MKTSIDKTKSSAAKATNTGKRNGVAPHSSGADEHCFLQRCIGVDLGDVKHHYCVVSASGEVEARGVFPNNAEAMTEFAQQWKNTRLVLECAAQSSWISHHFKNCGCDLDVVVANARQVELISKNTRKCDAHDAEALARLGRADVSLLYPIKHRGLEAQRDMAQLRMRDALVRQRVSITNSVRGLLKSVGQAVPGADPASFPKKCRETLPPETVQNMEPMLLVLEMANTQIAAIEKQIEKLIAQRYPDAARLRSVDGVGPITALAYVLTIDDATRFRRCRDVGAFLGLVPRRDQSGSRDTAIVRHKQT